MKRVEGHLRCWLPYTLCGERADGFTGHGTDPFVFRFNVVYDILQFVQREFVFTC